MTTAKSSKKPSEIKKVRANWVEKIEKVFSDPTLFKAYVNSAEDFYKKFDNNKFFVISKLANKVLKTKTRTILKKEQRKIANQIAEKYRCVLLGQEKVVKYQILNNDVETVGEQNNKSTKNMEIADKINVSPSTIIIFNK